MAPVRIAVVGAGSFGRNHARVLKSLAGVDLIAMVDSDAARAAATAGEFGCEGLTGAGPLIGRLDAVVVAVPTAAHESVAAPLLEAGIDVLVEKPIAADVAAARRLTALAEARGRILQVGHLERFNPAVEALEARLTTPLFFEVHRLSLFSPRSLDVDVVLDLMIHDLEIILAMTGEMPHEVRAAGLDILSSRVDIASVRLAFPGGAIANLTASRVSTEQVRKLRVFQPHQYISLDYSKQEVAIFSVGNGVEIAFEKVDVTRAEPLARELAAFIDSVRTRAAPKVDGAAATRALEVAGRVLDKIEEHNEVVSQRLNAHPPNPHPPNQPSKIST